MKSQTPKVKLPKNICDTCGKAYTVNKNHDKHDCITVEKVFETIVRREAAKLRRTI